MALQLREGLNITEDQDRSFSIEFISFDRNRRKEAERIKLNSCVRVGATHSRKQNDTIVVKQIDRNAHPYTVHIHLITQINDQEIYL